MLLLLILCLFTRWPCLWIRQKLQRHKQELRLLNYVDYVPQSLLDKFTEETGITVIYNVMPDAEGSMIELQLLIGAVSQDLVLLSLHPQAQDLSRLDLFRPIPLSIITTIPYEIPKEDLLRTANDPTEQIRCVPYALGTVSVAYNTEKIHKALGFTPKDPLDLVFDYNTVVKLHQQGMRLSILDSGTEVFSALGLYLKNKTGIEASVDEIEEHLLKLRKFYARISVLLYTHDIEQGHAEIALGWSNFLREAAQKNPSFIVVQPKHSVAWLDVLVIPKNTPNYQNALRFLKFITKPEHIKIIQERYYCDTKFDSKTHNYRKLTQKDRYDIQGRWLKLKFQVHQARDN